MSPEPERGGWARAPGAAPDGEGLGLLPLCAVLSLSVGPRIPARTPQSRGWRCAPASRTAPLHPRRAEQLVANLCRAPVTAAGEQHRALHSPPLPAVFDLSVLFKNIP